MNIITVLNHTNILILIKNWAVKTKIQLITEAIIFTLINFNNNSPSTYFIAFET